MNRQRKVVITTTYNEMGIIIDTKAEEVAQPDLQPTCNQLATDCISRQAAIDALEKVAELYPWKVPGKRDTYDSYNEAWNDAIGRAEMEIETLSPGQPLVIHCTACEDWHTKQGISGIAVSKLPPEQPEIIHCRDCRYSTDFYQDGCCYCKRPSEEMRYIEEGYGFYCAGAERREK